MSLVIAWMGDHQAIPGVVGFPHHLHLQRFRLVCFSKYLINGEALHPIGLCLLWFGATLFSLDPILPFSVTLAL